MSLEEMFALKFFIIPSAVVLLAMPGVFIYAYIIEYRERKRRNNIKNGINNSKKHKR